MSIEALIAANTAALEKLTAALLSGQTTQPAPTAPVVEIEDKPSDKAEKAKPDNLRGLFVQLGKSKGKQAQLDVLKEFGAAKLSEIDPEQHPVVIEVVNKMLEA